MVPEWLFHRLTAADMQRLADLYRGVAIYLADRAAQAARDEATQERRLRAARTRRDAKAERNRIIWKLYQAGRSDDEIGRKVGLSGRQTRRIIRQLLTPASLQTLSAGRKTRPEGLPGRAPALAAQIERHASDQHQPEQPARIAGPEAWQKASPAAAG